MRKLSQPFVLVWMAFLAIATLAMAIVYNERKDSYALADASVLSSARMVAAQIEHSFDEVDALLQVVARRVQVMPERDEAALAQLQAQLHTEVSFYKWVQRVGLLDASGNVIVNSAWRHGERPILSAADRENFKRARAGEKGLMIEGPVPAKLDGAWSLILARRIDNPLGEFQGVVFAVVPVKVINDALARLQLGRLDTVSLRTADLLQVARYPVLKQSNPETGNRNVSSQLTRLTQTQPDLKSSTYIAVGPLDGIERLYAYQRTENKPLIVIVGKATTEIEVAWHKTAILVLAITLLSGFVLFGGARRLNRYQLSLKKMVDERTESLLDSEQRYRLLFHFHKNIVDAVPDGLIVMDAQGIISRCNEGVLIMLGYQAYELLGQSVEVIFPKPVSSNDAALPIWSQADGLARHKEGHFLPVHITVNQAEMDDQVQIVCALRDISRAKQQAARLEQQHERLQSIIQGTNAGTWEWDLQTGVLIINARWAAIVGYSIDELNPLSVKTWRNLVHKDDLVVASKLLDAHFVGELAYYDCELRMKHKQGHWVHVLARGQVCRWDEYGQPLLMSGTHLDITERRRLEIELAAKEHFMRSLIDIIPGMVAYWDNQLRCGFANMAYREWFGRDPEQMQGIHLKDLLGEKLFSLNEPYLKLALSGQYQQFERTLTKADGSIGYTWAHYVPDIIEGQVRGFFVLVSDVTEVKQVQIQLEHTNAVLEQRSLEAEAASRAKSAFVATMSHEIRTPMNAVLGLLELLQHTHLTQQQADYVHKAEGAAKSLLGILNDILDFSKIEAGKLILENNCFRLGDIWQNLSVILSAELRDKPVALSFDFDPQVPAVLRGDGMRLQQVLLNLVANAAKFTEQGEIVVRLRLIEQQKNAMRIEFSIRDTGIGISADRLAAVFEEFTQSENTIARRYGGTGLGLAISQRLVRLMGGELVAESTLGVGSCFHFELELLQDAETLAMSELLDAENTESLLSVTRSPFTETSPLAGLRLLVVEDNTLNQEVAEGLLTYVGASVRIVDNGFAALALLEKEAQHFDAVLMDIQMPEMDGYEATRRLRATGCTLPIIAMTANALSADREACLIAGMNDHIGKPIDSLVLINTLLHHCGKSSTVLEKANSPVCDEKLPVVPNGFDLLSALNRLNGNKIIYAQLAQRFIESYDDLIGRVEYAMQHADRGLMMRALHTLEGLAATLGAQPLATLARSFEDELRQYGGLLTEERLMALKRSFVQTIETLSTLVDFFAPITVAATKETLNLVHIMELLDALQALLIEQNMRAFDVLSLLQAEVGTEFNRLFVALESTIQRLDFAAALEVVSAIRKGFEQ